MCHTGSTSAFNYGVLAPAEEAPRARLHCAVPAAYRKSNNCCEKEPERLAPAPFERMKHWFTGFLGVALAFLPAFALPSLLT